MMRTLRRVGRANGTPLDVGVLDRGVGGLGLDVFGLARVGRASAASDTGGGGISVGGVGRVEPAQTISTNRM